MRALIKQSNKSSNVKQKLARQLDVPTNWMKEQLAGA